MHLILLLTWQNNSVRPNGRFPGSRAFGIESHVLTPEESKEIYPLLDANNFYASLYSPQDGNIDPNGFCTALARGATNAGAKESRTIDFSAGHSMICVGAYLSTVDFGRKLELHLGYQMTRIRCSLLPRSSRTCPSPE